MILFPLLLAPLLAGGAIAFQDTAGLDRAVAAFTSRPVGAEGGARTDASVRDPSSSRRPPFFFRRRI